MKLAKEANADILKKMYDILEDNNQKSLNQLLECASLTEEEYMQALFFVSSWCVNLIRLFLHDDTLH